MKEITTKDTIVIAIALLDRIKYLKDLITKGSPEMLDYYKHELSEAQQVYNKILGLVD